MKNAEATELHGLTQILSGPAPHPLGDRCLLPYSFSSVSSVLICGFNCFFQKSVFAFLALHSLNVANFREDFVLWMAWLGNSSSLIRVIRVIRGSIALVAIGGAASIVFFRGHLILGASRPFFLPVHAPPFTPVPTVPFKVNGCLTPPNGSPNAWVMV